MNVGFSTRFMNSTYIRPACALVNMFVISNSLRFNMS